MRFPALVVSALLLTLGASDAHASPAAAKQEAEATERAQDGARFAPVLKRVKAMEVLAKASARRASANAALDGLERALRQGTEALDRLKDLLEDASDAKTLLEGERLKRRIARAMVGIRIDRARLYAARPAMSNAHEELDLALRLAGNKPELIDARAALEEQEERAEENYERDRRRDRSVNGAGFEGRRGGRFGNDRRGLLGR